MKASQIDLGGYSSFLFKGPWGFSKTCAASTFCLEGPVYLAYFDKKQPLELQHFYHKIVKRPDLLDRIEIDIFSAPNAGKYLEKMMELSKSCPYFAVITDSVTNLTASAVNWSLSHREERKDKAKLKVLPDWDEYKVETSMVTQALDIGRSLNAHVIWTAHPLPGIKVEGEGRAIKVTKTNPIVSYGSKVAGIVPGQFSEIYQFSKRSSFDPGTGDSGTRFVVDPDAIGDEFAKSNIGLTQEFDITNRMFYEVWKEEVRKFKEEMNNAIKQQNESNASNPNPFAGKTNNPWA